MARIGERFQLVEGDVATATVEGRVYIGEVVRIYGDDGVKLGWVDADGNWQEESLPSEVVSKCR